MKTSQNFLIVLAASLIGFSGFNLTAAEEKTEAKTTESVNPITKTVTKKNEFHHKRKAANGANAEINETQTKRTMKNGSTGTTTEQETKTSPAE